ncbi:MAG: cell division protein ZapA [Gemmatimonadaceae bacterium]|nr:cell division protein ZapA [Gemmatimonadaceae bacterium]
MDRRNVVKVRIVGEEYTLRTEASEARTRAVAEHVDRVVRTILDSGAVVETHKAAILAALGDLRPLLPPAKRGDETIG